MHLENTQSICIWISIIPRKYSNNLIFSRTDKCHLHFWQDTFLQTNELLYTLLRATLFWFDIKNISLWASIFLFEILYYTEFLYSCLRYYILRWASIFHFEFLYSCSRYYIPRWASIFLFEILNSTLSFYIRVRDIKFYFELL